MMRLKVVFIHRRGKKAILRYFLLFQKNKCGPDRFALDLFSTCCGFLFPSRLLLPLSLDVLSVSLLPGSLAFASLFCWVRAPRSGRRPLHRSGSSRVAARLVRERPFQPGFYLPLRLRPHLLRPLHPHSIPSLRCNLNISTYPTKIAEEKA
jgi:hypothetical protein